MTQDEQNRLIGEMVSERNVLRRKTTCLEEKLRRAKEGMSRASEAVNRASQGDWRQAEGPFTFLNAGEFTTVLADLRAAKERIAEIDEALDSV